MPAKSNRWLIRTLLNRELITESQLNETLAKQRETKQSLDEILLELNFIDKKQLKALKKEEPVPAYEEKSLLKRVDPEVLKLIPETIARRYHLIPLSKDGKVITVAMADPNDIV
ncbi:unnamed protein product, partial [marine sediment metagenome]